MLLKSLGVFSLITAIAASATGVIWAAVPLSQVRHWQNGAPEALDITALSVDQNSATGPFGNGGSVTTTRVTLTAKVDVVHRTASDLVPGSVIVVRYSIVRHTPPIPGIQRDIVLDVGESAAAYLKRATERTYILACAFGCLERL